MGQLAHKRVRDVFHDLTEFDIALSALRSPRIAGIYHDTLGSAMTSAADRALADALREQVPAYRGFVHENRRFVRRAVREVERQGIRQYVDVGCGQPGIGSVYDLVRETDAQARVLHVDTDPVVVHAVRNVIADDPHSAVIRFDLVNPQSLFEDPAARATIDLGRPVGIIAGAVFHSITDTRRLRIALHAYFDLVAENSVLCASHANSDSLSVAQRKGAMALLAEAGIIVVSRSKPEFQSLFDSWKLQPDGVMPLHRWRPDSDSGTSINESLGYGAMATK